MRRILQHSLRLALAFVLLLTPSFISQAAPASSADKPLSVLILGIDTGALGRTDQGRSDTIMVLTLNPRQGQLRLVSLPRDTYVSIPGQEGLDKLNHAYAYGGPTLSKQAVEALLEISIDHYIAVDMKGLEDLVDLVGGIEVTPPETFSIDGYQFFEGQPTPLDGRTALYYVRDRFSSSGDYARQARQRQVLEVLMHKAQAADFHLDPIALAGLMGSVTTDMSLDQLLQLFNHYRTQSYQLVMDQLKGSGTTIDGIYYDLPDEDALGTLRTTLQSDLAE